jgi:hypothetical protein
MYALVNTMNHDRIVSRHRTVEAAVKANDRLQSLTKKNNGQSSYLPTKIRRIDGDALLPLNDQEQDAADYAAMCG